MIRFDIIGNNPIIVSYSLSCMEPHKRNAQQELRSAIAELCQKHSGWGYEVFETKGNPFTQIVVFQAKA